MVSGVIIAENLQITCYWRLEKHATELIVDGTHVDDLSEERPGIKALREKGIRSPMLEIGIKKCDIREIARECGLSIYDKPPNSCLASRNPKRNKSYDGKTSKD